MSCVRWVMAAEELLERLGLTKNEVKTYLALLELGSVPAGPLIKRLGMHRAAVYNLLDILIDKGLVHYVMQAKRKYFEAQKPERLVDLINAKKQNLDEQEQQLMKVLPELELKRKLSKEIQEGTLYKGKKGLKSIFEDVLMYDTDMLIYGASGKFKELFPAYYIHWHKRRYQKKIKIRIIYSELVRKQKREKELQLIDVKYLHDINITPSTTFVYGDKVVIVLWSEIPMAFLMRSKVVAESHRHFFGLLWEKAEF